MKELTNFMVFDAFCRFLRFQMHDEILQQGDRIAIFQVCTAYFHIKEVFKGLLTGILKMLFWGSPTKGLVKR